MTVYTIGAWRVEFDHGKEPRAFFHGQEITGARVRLRFGREPREIYPVEAADGQWIQKQHMPGPQTCTVEITFLDPTITRTEDFA